MFLGIRHITARIRQIRNSDGLGALVARGASGSLVVMVISTGLVFVVQTVLARLMGVSQYGIYVYALTWIQILSLIATLGLDNALIRFVAAYMAQEEWHLLRGILNRSVRYGLLASLIIGFVAGLIVWVLRNETDEELATTLWIAFTLLPVTVLINLRKAILRGLKYVVRANVDTVLRPSLFGLVVLGLYYLGSVNK